MQFIPEELDSQGLCLRLQGRLDTAGAAAAEADLLATLLQRPRDSVLCLAGVPFVSSMGIRLVIAAARQLQVAGGRLAVCGAQGLVQEVLEHVALDQLLPVAPDAPQALQQLRALG